MSGGKRLRLGMEPGIEMSLRPEMYLVCDCCGSRHHAQKAWQDRLEAILFGAEPFAICPVCTQAPPKSVFRDPAYRGRCRWEVRRLKRLLEEAREADKKAQASCPRN